MQPEINFFNEFLNEGKVNSIYLERFNILATHRSKNYNYSFLLSESVPDLFSNGEIEICVLQYNGQSGLLRVCKPNKILSWP